MAGKSDFLENAFLDHVFGVTAYTAPTGVYVALLTADPTDAGDMTAEIAVGGYARTQATFGAAVAGVSTNSADITFPTATADWGTVTHFAVMDASTAGNMLYSGGTRCGKNSHQW